MKCLIILQWALQKYNDNLKIKYIIFKKKLNVRLGIPKTFFFFKYKN